MKPIIAQIEAALEHLDSEPDIPSLELAADCLHQALNMINVVLISKKQETVMKRWHSSPFPKHPPEHH